MLNDRSVMTGRQGQEKVSLAQDELYDMHKSRCEGFFMQLLK